MIVAEFIEWLKTQDQEAIVDCVVDGVAQPFTEELVYYMDFRNSKSIPEDHPLYGCRYLQIGAEA